MPEVLSSPPEWSYTCQCSGCKARLKATIEDIAVDDFKVSGYWFDDSAVCERKYYFTCPFCRQILVVPDKKLTKLVKQQAKPYSN